MQKLKRIPLSQRLANTLKTLPKLGGKLLLKLPRLPDPLTTVVLIASTLLILAMCSGCSPRMVKPTLPPQADSRQMPLYDGKTYRDAILYLIEVREWGTQCEADKAAIRRVYGE